VHRNKAAHQPRNKRQQICPYLCSEGPAIPFYICLSAGLVSGHHNGLHFPILVICIPGTSWHDAPVLHNVVRQDLPAGNIKNPNSAFALLDLVEQDLNKIVEKDSLLTFSRLLTRVPSTVESNLVNKYKKVSKESFLMIL